MLGKQEVRKLKEVLYSKSFPGKTQFICLLTPDGPTTDPSTGTIKVHLGETISFIAVTYKNLGEGLLKGSEMTLRQLAALLRY